VPEQEAEERTTKTPIVQPKQVLPSPSTPKEAERNPAEVTAGFTPSEPVVLDQKNCRYEPHILGVQTDQTIVIRNSDPFLHNIHPVPENNRGFNVGQPTQGMETERTFSSPEIMIPVGCDVHGWMSAYIGVLDHPYFAVTGSDGSFQIPNLPPGEYTIEAWHETFGVKEMKVTVDEGGTATADFTFEG
jgi:hypothetical protein